MQRQILKEEIRTGKKSAPLSVSKRGGLATELAQRRVVTLSLVCVCVCVCSKAVKAVVTKAPLPATSVCGLKLLVDEALSY